MAARKKAKKSETLILPLISSDVARPKRNTGKTLGNFGAYVLLPSLDPVQNMNAIYDVKTFCKILCEWYISWRIWQKEVLLCSLSAKCSANLLTSLSTILEPVFHRNFLSRLHGEYPDFKKKGTKLISRHGIKTPKVKNHSVKVKVTKTKTDILSEKKVKEKVSGTINEENITKETFNENEMRCDMQRKEVEVNRELIVSESPLTNLMKESLLEGGNFNNLETKEVFHIKAMHDSINQAGPFLFDRNDCRSCHIHTANIYNQEIGSRFFDKSCFKRLSDMKANLSCAIGLKLRPRVLSGLDQKGFKHHRWWSADPLGKPLIPAQGLNLWKYFSMQLSQVNEVIN